MFYGCGALFVVVKRQVASFPLVVLQRYLKACVEPTINMPA